MQHHSTSASLLLTLLFALTAGVLPAAPLLQLDLTDNWTTPQFGIAQLTGGPGTDFDGTWSSAVNAVLLEVKHSGMTGWNITVRRVDISWGAGLKVYVKRNPGGSGGATMYDGLVYQEITATDTYFFRGEGGDKKNMPLQFQLTGISVPLGAATFSTTVYYTVTEY